MAFDFWRWILSIWNLGPTIDLIFPQIIMIFWRWAFNVLFTVYCNILSIICSETIKISNIYSPQTSYAVCTDTDKARTQEAPQSFLSKLPAISAINSSGKNDQECRCWRRGEALTAKQGLWTYLMDPRQRHGEMRVLCGSMLGSWHILDTWHVLHVTFSI